MFPANRYTVGHFNQDSPEKRTKLGSSKNHHLTWHLWLSISPTTFLKAAAATYDIVPPHLRWPQRKKEGKINRTIIIMALSTRPACSEAQRNNHSCSSHNHKIKKLNQAFLRLLQSPGHWNALLICLTRIGRSQQSVHEHLNSPGECRIWWRGAESNLELLLLITALHLSETHWYVLLLKALASFTYIYIIHSIKLCKFDTQVHLIGVCGSLAGKTDTCERWN